MTQVHRTRCCGMREIEGIMGREPEDILMDVVPTLIDINGVYAIFTCPEEVDEDGEEGEDDLSGDNLRDYIVENELGEVTTVGPNLNPNSENQLTLYVWTFERTVIQPWHTATLARRTLERQRATNGGFAIDDVVIHEGWGQGRVAQIREGYQSNIGVAFRTAPRDGHNLNGHLDGATSGKWVSAGRLSLLEE